MRRHNNLGYATGDQKHLPQRTRSFTEDFDGRPSCSSRDEVVEWKGRSFPSGLFVLKVDVDYDAHPWVDGIEEIVLIVHIVDVDIVIVAPGGRPRISDVEPVSAVLEAGPALVDLGTVEAEVVFPAEVLMEVLLRDASAISGGTSLRAVVVIRTRMVVMRLTVTLLLSPSLLVGLGFGVLLLYFLVLLGLMLLGFGSVLLLGVLLIVLSTLSVVLRALLFFLLRMVVWLWGLPLRLWMCLLCMLGLRLGPLALGMFRLRPLLAWMLFSLLGKSAGCTES
jgi:hypothetical protein